MYWDGLATIAPVQYLEDPSHFSPLMRSLLREELIEIVQPEEYAYFHYEDYNTFLDWALHNAASFNLEPNRVSGERPISYVPYDVHTGKLSYRFANEFVLAGLSRRIDSEWFQVDQKLGMAFMMFLSILIGQETDRDPVTDWFLGISSLFYIDRHTASGHSANIQSALHNSIFDQILPVPQCLYGTKGLQQFRKFKERYPDELEQFRRHIEDFILSIDGLSETFQTEQRDIFLKNFKEEIDDLKGHMGWFQAPQIDMGTFIAAASCAVSALSGGLAGSAVSIVALN